MKKITRNAILNYISNNFQVEKQINPVRIFEINDKPIVIETIRDLICIL